MGVKLYIVIEVFFIFFFLQTKGQDRITTNPEKATIISADIDHFWEAYDSLANQKSTVDSLNVIRTIFVEPASEGLRQYMHAANCFEKQYLEAIKERKADYRAVREKTQILGRERQRLLQYLNRFKQLYPSLRIPVICYTIGIFQVGGTQFENTLYIGCETDIMADVDITAQTIHELAHFQQKDQNPTTDLDLAMIEGGAEFVCYQVTGKRTLSETWTYGLANEANLWNDFGAKKDSTINMKWFLNISDTTNRRPGSLGYFIGFRICESYLQNHDNKKSLLIDIIEMENPKKIFLESLYHPK